MPDAATLKWLSELGPGLFIAVLVLLLWRMDRKVAEDRLAALAKDWREVVENNTKAMTTIELIVQRGLVECPYAKRDGGLTHVA